MIDSKKLLVDLQKQVRKLEADLKKRCDEHPEVNAPLLAAYEAARQRKRTAAAFGTWRTEELTQVAVAWVLACVFIRFLEDNALLEVPRLSGPGAAGGASGGPAGGGESRLQRAKDETELFFRRHPTLTEREYLEEVFTQAQKLPALGNFLDRKHNPLWEVGPCGDFALEMLEFWRKIDPETGRLIHDFTDPEWDTRFLGDLYQDLSEFARKRYALLQTPDFVEEFILDRTLTPAIETFGNETVRMIDPTCGSGHFLLGGFRRLLRLWQTNHPELGGIQQAQRALDQVYGVDLNPNVVAIARFRLLLEALKASGIRRLADAPAFEINVATGDSLLHGRRFREFEGEQLTQRTFDTEDVFKDELKHFFEVEDEVALHKILGQQYHAVVGNPPYITVKDAALSDLYRIRYNSCHRKYSLSVPFMDRFFDLAVKGSGDGHRAGFVGQITANSFMKREFGKKLIEEFLPRWNLTHVIDTSGAYIPGHGTPTVIIFGRHELPVDDRIRTVLGIAGEPSVPSKPSNGVVWTAISEKVDSVQLASKWVSSSDSSRATFHKHPWSIGGGGAAELKDTLDGSTPKQFEEFTDNIGFMAIVSEDEAFLGSRDYFLRKQVLSKSFITGDSIRDWVAVSDHEIAYPYLEDENNRTTHSSITPSLYRLFWPNKTALKSRKMFGKCPIDFGMEWFEYIYFTVSRYFNPGLIAFSSVATHAHFCSVRFRAILNRHAPVASLKASPSEISPIALLSILNSSSACFWLKQVLHNKGSTVDVRGARQRTSAFEDFYEFNGTQLAHLPIPESLPEQLPISIDKYAQARRAQEPRFVLEHWSGHNVVELRKALLTTRELAESHLAKIIGWQEELDWQVYECYGLIEPEDQVRVPEGEAMDLVYNLGLKLGQRSFEIVLARKMAAGEVQTTWFERHGSTPITEVPNHWPTAYRELVERRIRRIETDSNIRLIEQPEYKRRWNTPKWEEQFNEAAEEWMSARLEGYFFEGQRVAELRDGFQPGTAGFAAALQPHLTTVNTLASIVQGDRGFLAVAEVYKGSAGFSVAALIRDLVGSGSVPFLPVQRYKPSGLEKRVEWERVWDLQRQEDAIDAAEGVDGPDFNQLNDLERAKRKAAAAARKKAEIGDIPVPPKYTSADFKKSTWWSLRGKLDVPKERWVSYPGAERDNDTSLVIAWAGWNHLQQAQALAEYYIDAKTNQGWPNEKLALLLAGLLDLLPWLKQWHNQIDPDIGMGLGDYFSSFLDDECRSLGLTLEKLNWLRLVTLVAMP